MRRKWFFIAPAAIAGGLLLAFLGGELVMLLWNWLMPPIFGWHQITFWQSLGLLVLCRVLFGGFGRHGGSRHWSRGGEERERMRQRMRERCGVDHTATSTQGPATV